MIGARYAGSFVIENKKLKIYISYLLHSNSRLEGSCDRYYYGTQSTVKWRIKWKRSIKLIVPERDQCGGVAAKKRKVIRKR